MNTYFVLKDEGGKSAGCVRLEGGKARSTCPCTVLLEDGTALPLDADETPLPAKALGAAVLQGDGIVAWGAVPGAKLTGAELLYRLKKERPGKSRRIYRGGSGYGSVRIRWKACPYNGQMGINLHGHGRIWKLQFSGV